MVLVGSQINGNNNVNKCNYNDTVEIETNKAHRSFYFLLLGIFKTICKCQLILLASLLPSVLNIYFMN